MNSYESIFKQMGESARAASIVLQQLPEVRINEILCDMADALVQHSEQILLSNNMDMDSARGVVPNTMLDRLLLSKDRIHQMAEGVRQVSLLPSPVGTVLENIDRPNGLHIEKRAVPFGVIGIIFEARPNVTVDAGALCFKTANATILRGGKEAFHTNRIIVSIMQDVLESHNLPREAIQLVEVLDREAVSILLQQRRYIDVVIPRGGAGLIQRVVRDSMIPVIETGSGICHTYVDAEANIDMAVDIAVNAKVQRPSVCNSMETLLVHRSIAKEFLLALETKLVHHHVTIHGTPEVLQIVNGVAVDDNSFGTEYNDFDLNVAIVSSVDEAISHINRYTTHHSEAIVTDNNTTAQYFMNVIDCSTVYHNASTRFTDGFEFGFGAEIGISTQKLHARGPMGLQALTSYKYFVFGTGQIRS